MSSLDPGSQLAADLVEQVEDLLLHAEEQRQAVEVDPHRGRLFELFVMADASGFLAENSPHDLTCDGIGRELAARWELARHMGGGSPGAMPNPAQLPPAQLSKMRLLWSFMRMWMEWTYAWKRWSEFHGHDFSTGSEKSPSPQ